MIENLKPYPETKDSGLPWLGEVPAHWEIRPAAGAFSPIRKRNTGMKENTVLSLSYGRIVVKPAERLHGLVPESFETYQIVNPGDIVIRTTDLQNDKTSLRTGFVRDRGIITSAYLALSASAGVLPEFGYQFLNTWDISKAIYGYGSGLRQNLDFSDFRRMPVSVPPIAEQAAIARFLAWATNRLDRAIGAKRRIIALLQEQKQAIIHRAVTRGLDPSVPLKDSGIPWLGQIPEHWEVTALRRYWSVTDCKHLTVPFVENGIPLASVREVRKFELDLSKCKHTTPEWYQHLIHGGRKPEEGDIIYCRNVSVGSSALVTTNATFAMGQDVCLIRSELQNGQYLNYVLHSPFMKKQLELILVGSTFKRINVAQIKALMAPIPPRQEQNAIAHYLGEELRGLENASSRLESEITLLREYRTRLIADVVTGKLDVREVAAQLPEEIDSSAAFEDGFGEDDTDGVTLDETEADLDEA